MDATDLMTPEPVRVTGGMTVAEAMRAMEEHEIRHLAVVEGERLVGVISDRDLMRTTGWLTARVMEDLELEPARVRDVLRPKPLVVTPRTPCAEVAERLVEWGVGCAPVVEEERLVGIVTEMDLLRAFLAARRYGQLGEEGDPHVETCMATEVETIDRSTSLGEAASLLEAADYRHLPVVEDGRLLGIVSDRDLRMLRGRGEPEEALVAELVAGQILTAAPRDPLSYAACLMLEHRFGSVPVEEQGAFLGLVTTTDVLVHCSRVLA